MPSKKCRLPVSFDTFSHLSPKQIDEVRIAAIAAATAYTARDEAAYGAILHAANKSLSKHKLGLFLGIMISHVSKP